MASDIRPRAQPTVQMARGSRTPQPPPAIKELISRGQFLHFPVHVRARAPVRAPKNTKTRLEGTKSRALPCARMKRTKRETKKNVTNEKKNAAKEKMNGSKEKSPVRMKKAQFERRKVNANEKKIEAKERTIGSNDKKANARAKTIATNEKTRARKRKEHRE